VIDSLLIEHYYSRVHYALQSDLPSKHYDARPWMLMDAETWLIDPHLGLKLALKTA